MTCSRPAPGLRRVVQDRHVRLRELVGIRVRLLLLGRAQGDAARGERLGRAHEGDAAHREERGADRQAGEDRGSPGGRHGSRGCGGKWFERDLSQHGNGSQTSIIFFIIVIITMTSQAVHVPMTVARIWKSGISTRADSFSLTVFVWRANQRGIVQTWQKQDMVCL